MAGSDAIPPSSSSLLPQHRYTARAQVYPSHVAHAGTGYGGTYFTLKERYGIADAFANGTHTPVPVTIVGSESRRLGTVVAAAVEDWHQLHLTAEFTPAVFIPPHYEFSLVTRCRYEQYNVVERRLFSAVLMPVTAVSRMPMVGGEEGGI